MTKRSHILKQTCSFQLISASKKFVTLWGLWSEKAFIKCRRTSTGFGYVFDIRMKNHVIWTWQIDVHLYIYLSIYLCIYLSIYLSIFLSIYLSIHVFVYASIYISKNEKKNKVQENLDSIEVCVFGPSFSDLRLSVSVCRSVCQFSIFLKNGSLVFSNFLYDGR